MGMAKLKFGEVSDNSVIVDTYLWGISEHQKNTFLDHKMLKYMFGNSTSFHSFVNSYDIKARFLKVFVL